MGDCSIKCQTRGMSNVTYKCTQERASANHLLPNTTGGNAVLIGWSKGGPAHPISRVKLQPFSRHLHGQAWHLYGRHRNRTQPSQQTSNLAIPSQVNCMSQELDAYSLIQHTHLCSVTTPTACHSPSVVMQDPATRPRGWGQDVMMSHDGLPLDACWPWQAISAPEDRVVCILHLSSLSHTHTTHTHVQTHTQHTHAHTHTQHTHTRTHTRTHTHLFMNLLSMLHDGDSVPHFGDAHVCENGLHTDSKRVRS